MTWSFRSKLVMGEFRRRVVGKLKRLVGLGR
jgi:hypothetical protein